MIECNCSTRCTLFFNEFLIKIQAIESNMASSLLIFFAPPSELNV